MLMHHSVRGSRTWRGWSRFDVMSVRSIGYLSSFQQQEKFFPLSFTLHASRLTPHASCSMLSSLSSATLSLTFIRASPRQLSDLRNPFPVSMQILFQSRKCALLLVILTGFSKHVSHVEALRSLSFVSFQLCEHGRSAATRSLRHTGTSCPTYEFQRKIGDTQRAHHPILFGERSPSDEIRKSPSPFGKAAIGKKTHGQLATLETQRRSAKTNPTPKIRQVDLIKSSSKTSLKGAQKDKCSTPSQDLNKILERRDEALLAFKTHINLPLSLSLQTLNRFPRLYTELPSLASKLLYLLEEINIKPKQLRRMMECHPRLMETVLLDSEDNIASTIEILQTELDLSTTDIKMIQSQSLPAILSYPRSELRQRILVYRQDLQFNKPNLTRMVLKDPRMLRTNAKNVRQILEVFEDELGVGRSDIRAMLAKNCLTLTYKAEENILPTIQYLKNGEIGQCLGMAERKGISTLLQPSDREDIVAERVKALIMGHPKLLSSSIERNLKPKVEFFLEEIGLSRYEFGRVLYRRGGILLEANVERTLRVKVGYLRQKLGLEIKDTVAMEEDGLEEKKQSIAIPQPTDKTEISYIEKKRLFAQMIAKNPDILTLSIDKNLAKKFEYFSNRVGLNQKEIQYFFLKYPQVLALSLERNIIPKIECFLTSRDEGGLGMEVKDVRDWLVQNPRVLTFALESRILPRIQDAIRLQLEIGKNLPDNFISRSEKKWKSFLIDQQVELGDSFQA